MQRYMYISNLLMSDQERRAVEQPAARQVSLMLVNDLLQQLQ